MGMLKYSSSQLMAIAGDMGEKGWFCLRGRPLGVQPYANEYINYIFSLIFISTFRQGGAAKGKGADMEVWRN